MNILVGYCGQISLGIGRLHGGGRLRGLQLLRAHRRHAADRRRCCWAALCATAFGVLFGIPSLRIKGLYLAVATLAAQFFSDWAFLRIKWFTNDSPSGSVVGVEPAGVRPADRQRRRRSTCSAWRSLAVFALLAKNLVRGAIGREWMAIRDMDVAAAVIGIRPMYAKLTAFAVSSFIVGVAGALWGFVYLGAWEPAAFSIDRSFQLLFMVIIGGLGSIMGSFFGAAFIVVLPIVLDQLLPVLAGCSASPIDTAGVVARRADDLRRADRVLPDRRAARPGPAVVDRQGEAAAVALPALTSHEFPRTARVPSCSTTRRQT